MRKYSIEIQLHNHSQLIAISDIHGHLSLFDELIARIAPEPDSHLIILGDFINKGPDNIGTVKRMMTLENRPNTYVLKGNHEYFLCKYLYDTTDSQDFLLYLKEEHFKTLIHDCVDDSGMSIHDFSDMTTLRYWLMTNYGDLFDYIHTRPAILFADDMIFVHGGYDKSVDITRHEGKLLKYDDFNTLSDINEGLVIVGHWPTANLRKNRNTNTPFYNLEKNIISIDGGIGVKSSGELNALLINYDHGKRTIRHQQVNHFERRQILDTYVFETEDKLFINYPDFEVDLIEVGTVISKCRHLKTGKILSIFNDVLDRSTSQARVTTTYINHFFNLNIGDEVELVTLYDHCALVKHNDEFGWVWRWQI